MASKIFSAEVKTMSETNPLPERGGLGQYLWDIRQATRMTLREVEEVSGRKVSNAYLSQLETKKITKPSPTILHELAVVYSPRLPQEISSADLYQRLMELAGYIRPAGEESDQRSGKLPTFAKEQLTADEEAELLKYLAFLRMRRGSK
jgi:transcriptional regulator with XRE-family HTH domain